MEFFQAELSNNTVIPIYNICFKIMKWTFTPHILFMLPEGNTRDRWKDAVWSDIVFADADMEGGDKLGRRLKVEFRQG